MGILDLLASHARWSAWAYRSTRHPGRLSDQPSSPRAREQALVNETEKLVAALLDTANAGDDAGPPACGTWPPPLWRFHRLQFLKRPPIVSDPLFRSFGADLVSPLPAALRAEERAIFRYGYSYCIPAIFVHAARSFQRQSTGPVVWPFNVEPMHIAKTVIRQRHPDYGPRRMGIAHGRRQSSRALHDPRIHALVSPNHFVELLGWYAVSVTGRDKLVA